ncbi:hypothetical protein Plhal304r1_c009g0035891 [Plasmopara halstedii]
MLHVQTLSLPIINLAEPASTTSVPKLIDQESSKLISSLQISTSPLERKTKPDFAKSVAHDDFAVPHLHPHQLTDSKNSVNRSVGLQQPCYPIQLKNLSFPKRNELLIDRETRAAANAHKLCNKSSKIQNLISSDCVGRVNAISRNLPMSIRSRLLASANVSKRRERLYDLLCRDYDELSKRYTRRCKKIES